MAGKAVGVLFAGDLLEQLQPARIDLFFRNRVAQCAAGFMRVAAIVKAA